MTSKFWRTRRSCLKYCQMDVTPPLGEEPHANSPAFLRHSWWASNSAVQLVSPFSVTQASSAPLVSAQGAASAAGCSSDILLCGRVLVRSEVGSGVVRLLPSLGPPLRPM